jgi:hypothetical protein
MRFVPVEESCDQYEVIRSITQPHPCVVKLVYSARLAVLVPYDGSLAPYDGSADEPTNLCISVMSRC